jgi:hypothetical protein
MFKLTLSTATALILSIGVAFAQDDDSASVLDDTADVGIVAGAELELDDADTDASQGGLDGEQAIIFGKSPLAYGTVRSSGSKYRGSSNWSSSYNSTYKRYEISINGNSYYYLNYATVITPAGDARFCRSSSVGGKLLVYCYDHAGVTRPSRFGFLTFKP